MGASAAGFALLLRPRASRPTSPPGRAVRPRHACRARGATADPRRKRPYSGRVAA